MEPRRIFDPLKNARRFELRKLRLGIIYSNPGVFSMFGTEPGAEFYYVHCDTLMERNVPK